MTWTVGQTGWHWARTEGRIVGAVQAVGRRYRCYLVNAGGELTPLPGNSQTLGKAKAAVEKAAEGKR